MHLVSKDEQTISIADRDFKMKKGESIHTECSHKYTLSGFAEISKEASFRMEKSWTDEKHLFAVVLLKATV